MNWPFRRLFPRLYCHLLVRRLYLSCTAEPPPPHPEPPPSPLTEVPSPPAEPPSLTPAEPLPPPAWPPVRCTMCGKRPRIVDARVCIECLDKSATRACIECWDKPAPAPPPGPRQPQTWFGT